MSFPKCGAKRRRRSSTCQRPAGWGTNHPGEGYCKLHGGSSATHGYHMVRHSDEATREIVVHLENLIHGNPHSLFSEIDRPALENVAVLIRQRDRLMKFLDEHGFEHKSSPHASRLLATTTNSLLNYLNALGLTPTSRAKLGLDVARGFDLARALADSDHEYGN